MALGRVNGRNWRHWYTANLAVALEAVLAGAIEARLQVGASCVRMAWRIVFRSLIQVVATGERTVLVDDRAVDPALLGLTSAMVLATWTSVKMGEFIDADGSSKLAWGWVKFLALVQISAKWRISPSRLANTLVVDTSGTVVAFGPATYNWGFSGKVATGILTKVVPMGTAEHKSDGMG